jgi:Ca-activated chloride channel family protein
VQEDLTQEQRMCARTLLLCIAVLLLNWVAKAQSSDEVHVPFPGTPTTPTAREAHGPVDAMARSFRVDVNLVLVPVTVTDSLGRPVIALSQQDFTVYEGGKPQEIRYFTEEEAPISIAVLLDVSKSMSDKIDSERAAIVEFCNNANPDDEYFAITFSDHPRLLAGPTQAIDDVERRLIAVEPGGPTAMLDAIYLAEFKLRSARYLRKAIIIISDGGDNASRYTLREIKNLVQESDAQIYAIGLFDTFFFNTLEERLGKKWLSEITDRTGGRTITVDNRAKLPQAAAAIGREMRNQYVLGYIPGTKGDDRWRKIKVRVSSPAAKEPIQASYKQGYIAARR